MQAVVFPAPHAIEVRDVPPLTCEADEVLIRVHRAGLCGTDVDIHANEYLSDFPLIPGHEFCGTLEEVGEQIEGLEQLGEQVAADPNLGCGRCTFCRGQQNNHCLHWPGIGITRPGAFAELLSVPNRACYRLRVAIEPQLRRAIDDGG